MIWRVRDRSTFDELKRQGTRVRAGALGLTYLATETARPQVAFAIGRHAGSAVGRNRLRRRLRAVMTDVVRTEPGLVPQGAYVLAPGRGMERWPYPRLRRAVVEALAELERRR